MSDVDFVTAEPTIERVERFYALLHDMEDGAKIKEPAAQQPPPTSGPEPLSRIADEMEARSLPGGTRPLALDPERILHAFWGHVRMRELVMCVMVRADGTDLTDADVGRVRASALGSAVAPFYRELVASLSLFDAGALAEGYAMSMVPPAMGTA
jgi:hypothetical protein